MITFQLETGQYSNHGCPTSLSAGKERKCVFLSALFDGGLDVVCFDRVNYRLTLVRLCSSCLELLPRVGIKRNLDVALPLLW